MTVLSTYVWIQVGDILFEFGIHVSFAFKEEYFQKKEYFQAIVSLKKKVSMSHSD